MPTFRNDSTARISLLCRTLTRFAVLASLTCLFSVDLLAQNSTASTPQEKVQVMKIKEGDVFPIPEIGALVVKAEADLKIQFVPPAENRREPYKSVDLQLGDLILMANGKRVKTIKELTDAHASTTIGAEFKLGIQRGKEMMIVSFPKADPKDLPQRTMRIMTTGGEGAEVLPAVGVVLAQKQKSVVIDKILPVETAIVKTLDVKEGDVITAINGKPVATVKDFVGIYDGLEVGSPVTVKTDRKGAPLQVTFKKPKPMGPVFIRKEVQ
jgi:S1-C subfamily serine protease